LKLLLDTHAALWYLSDDQRLGDEARRHLDDESNVVLLSAAVAWEIAIKRGLGKLQVPDAYLDLLLGAGVQPLAVSLEHAAAVEALPYHHRDPFDRILVAQALSEQAALVSRESVLKAYGVTTIW
jgi:PIN domain nuclease of toxin-antitoxin system